MVQSKLSVVRATTEKPGDISVIGGRGNFYEGGDITIRGGLSNTGTGGDVYIEGGDSNGDDGGNIRIIGGESELESGGETLVRGGDGKYGGDLILTAGSGRSGAGDVVITAGSTQTEFDGGDVVINAGYGFEEGGNVLIYAGYADSSGSGSGNGGDIEIQAASASQGTNRSGGDVKISSGSGYDNEGIFGPDGHIELNALGLEGFVTVSTSGSNGTVFTKGGLHFNKDLALAVDDLSVPATLSSANRQGIIQIINPTLAAGASGTITVNNSKMVVDDVVVAGIRTFDVASGGIPVILCEDVGGSSFVMKIYNAGTTPIGSNEMTLSYILL